MQVILVLLGFVTVLSLLIGVVVFLLGDGTKEGTTGEWSVLAEAENSHEIHALKGVLEREDLPVIVETESPEVGGIPTTLTRNRLRVPRGQERKALQLIRNSDLNIDDFLIHDGDS